MAKRKRVSPKLKNIIPLNQRLSWSISEWSALRGISRITFWRLDKTGDAPKTMAVRGRRLITRDADHQWQKRMEKESPRIAG